MRNGTLYDVALNTRAMKHLCKLKKFQHLTETLVFKLESKFNKSLHHQQYLQYYEQYFNIISGGHGAFFTSII